MTQPATQYYDSQDSQEAYYSVNEQSALPPPIFTLTALYTGPDLPRIQFDLDERYNRWTFGREECHNVKNLPHDEQYFHVEEKFDRNLYLKISRKHFKIERLSFSSSNDQFIRHKNYQFVPVVICALSLNGLYVNDERLKANEMRILQHNDVIRLNKVFALFRFRYRNPVIISGLQETPVSEKYFFGDTIGTGGYGAVHIVYNVSTEAKADEMRKFAMKIIPTRSATNAKVSDKITKEATFMMGLDHVNVLQLVEYYKFDDKLIMILPMMWGGDLLHRIQEAPQRRLNEHDSKFFMLQMLRGLHYMHARGMAHRDIKCDNILLYDYSQSPLLKISDFGLSKVLEDENTICGTKNYSAPEILSNNVHYTTKVDIWSLGVCLYAMISGSFPFYETPGKPSLTEQIRRGKCEYPSRYFGCKEVSRFVVPFIRKMLQVDPNKRASIDVLMNDVWMRCPTVNSRLQNTYTALGVELDETLTDDQITQDLQNVKIDASSQPVVHVAKRPRLG